MANIGVVTNHRQVFNQTAKLVFESFESTDITFALISKHGSCTANKPDIFVKIFNRRNLLEAVCARIDDGDEPVMICVDDSLVVASGLSTGGDSGYIIMILPGYSPEKAAECTEFIEVILNQISLLAQQVECNIESSCFDGLAYDCQLPTGPALN